MDTSDKKTRSELKQYFKKNTIPTEKNFADFIDGVLNQQDDGIIKPAGDPVSLVALDKDHRPVLNLYTNVASASWTFCLAPTNPVTGAHRNGFSLGSAPTLNRPGGDTRLFIDIGTGNVGIGTVDPQQKLDVKGGILAESANVTGALTAGSTVAVTGAMSAQSTLAVTGAMSAQSTLAVRGAMSAQSTLAVTGPLTAQSTLDVAGAGTMQSTLDVVRALTARSTLDVTGKLSALSTLDITGKLSALSTFDALGAATARSTLDVTGKLSALSTLDVTGKLSANGGIDIKTEPRTKPNSHPTGRPLYVTGAITDTEGVEIRNSDASQGLGFGPTTIYAAGTSAKQDIVLLPKGPSDDPGAVRVKSGLYVSGALDTKALTVANATVTNTLTANNASVTSLSLGAAGVAANKIGNSITTTESTGDATTIPTMNAVRNYVKQVAPATSNSIGATTNGSDLATVQAVKDYVNHAAPIGMIVMWNGTAAPPGWALCDGTGGTPDLRDKFVLGAGNAARPKTGGAERVTLSTYEMPAHDHAGSVTNYTSISPNTRRNGSGWDSGGKEFNLDGRSDEHTGNAISLSHYHTLSIASNGSGGSHENMPPYYVLAFIMRVS